MAGGQKRGGPCAELGAGSWELLAGAGEQKVQGVCKYVVGCTFTCTSTTRTHSSQDETDGSLLVILFIILVPRPVFGVVSCPIANRRQRGPGCVCMGVGVGVVRDSLVVCVCLLWGGTKKISWRVGETPNQQGGGPRIAWPVLGTCTSAVCCSLCLFYYFSLLLLLFLFL